MVIEFRRRNIEFADIAAGNDHKKSQNLYRFVHLDSVLVLLLSNDGARCVNTNINFNFNFIIIIIIIIIIN